MSEGQVVFKGTDITRKKPYQVARMGLARTFQVIRVYGRLTVLQNLELSIQWGDVTPATLLRPCAPAAKERANDLATFFQLGQVRHELAMNLSGGQRRLLEIAMAMMPDPDVLLLDEATSGVNPTVIEQIKDRIRELNQAEGKTFLLIEHDIRFIADLCTRVVVLNYGEKLAEERRRTSWRTTTSSRRTSESTRLTRMADRSAEALLEVTNLHAGYRPGEDILKGVDLRVNDGEIVCVIGPNGAGKSTVFKALYGFIPARGRGRSGSTAETSPTSAPRTRCARRASRSCPSCAACLRRCPWRRTSGSALYRCATNGGCNSVWRTCSTCSPNWPSGPSRWSAR